jgi:hypothetical protein
LKRNPLSVQVLTLPELTIKHRVGKLGRHKLEGSCDGEQGIGLFPQIDESEFNEVVELK